MGTSGGKYEGNDIPDAITPVVGVRAWRVTKTLRKEDRLFSIYKQDVNWPIGRRLEAKCISPASIWGAMAASSWNARAALYGIMVDDPVKKLPPHQAPFDNCTCGIYALNSELFVGEVKPWMNDAILGIVLMWGHILEGDRGYRSQYAKVVALWMDTADPERVDLISQMAEMYKVPVILDLPGELEKQRKLQGGIA